MHSDHIQQLLDGELEAMHESQLFGELAVNADLRAELKQQLAIRAAVQHDRVGLVPPVTLTNSVFSGLGFAAPLAGAAAGAAGGSLLLQWFSRIGLPILSTLAAAGITFGVMQSDNRAVTGPDQAGAPSTVPAEDTQSVPPTPPPAPTAAATSNDASNAELARLRARNADLVRAVAALRAERDALASAAETEPTPESTPATTARMDEPPIQQVSVTNALALTYSQEPRMLQSTALTPIPNRFLTYPSFLVQVRGMSGSSLTDVSAPAQTSWYDNVGAALLYQLSERHAVGLEFGNEAFAMSFEGTRNGQTILYEQQPLSMWAGITYRHTFPSFGASGFAPFGQALIGGSKFGPLGRLTAGITYAPAGPLSFIFGLEGSTMAYQFQDSWYATSKIGLTYGVAVRF